MPTHITVTPTPTHSPVSRAPSHTVAILDDAPSLLLRCFFDDCLLRVVRPGEEIVMTAGFVHTGVAKVMNYMVGAWPL